MVDMTSLCELAYKWKTDKAPTEAYYSHSYTPYYFELLRGRSIKRMLEFGLGVPEEMSPPGYISGASHRMWQEYLPETEIYALDIREDLLLNEGHIKSFHCDQSSEASLRSAANLIGGKLDFIVDDGSHMWDTQVLSAKVFVPLLNPNGVYVIEDVYVDFVDRIHAALPFKYTIKVFNKSMCDDRLIVIQGE
jgi:hypothetical protein